MLVMLIFLTNAFLLRSPESPDFDLLVLHDGENDPEYVSGAYTFRIID